jgi:hypothetical protein
MTKSHRRMTTLPETAVYKVAKKKSKVTLSQDNPYKMQLCSHQVKV